MFLLFCGRDERLTPFGCKKMPKNIFELFEMFIDFQKLVLRFLISQTIFYPLNPPWNLSSVTDLEKSMSLEVSARKITEKKNHGEKSVQKLEKSVTLPSGRRFYKIFWSTFWSSLRIIWEFLILQDIVGIVPIRKSVKSFFHSVGKPILQDFWSTFWSSLKIIWEFLILQDIVGIVPIGKSLKSFFHFWDPKKLLTGHHGKVYKIKLQTRFSYGFPNQILKSLFNK